MPIDRNRRWASTVKPPTATRAMRSMAERGQGEHDGLGVEHVAAEAATADARLDVRTDRPRRHAVGVEQDSDLGGRFTWPGTTRANSSSRLWGFCDDADHPAGQPPWCQSPPTREVEGGGHGRS